MSEKKERIEAFYAKGNTWHNELAALREVLRDSPLSEDFKWNTPCYTLDGSNVAIVWSMKERCGLGFFKGALMNDPENVLVAPGENSRSMRSFNFTTVSEVTEHADTLKAYIREASEIERAGLKIDRPKNDIELPEELVEAFGTDPAFKAAFDALTPGRKRGYALHFAQPKQSKTRVSRIEKSKPLIFEGKGLHDR